MKLGLSPLPATPLHLIPLGRGAQEANPPPSKFKVRWRRARLSTQGYTGLASGSNTSHTLSSSSFSSQQMRVNGSQACFC